MEDIHTAHFSLENDAIPLPQGAFARARRLYVRWRRRTIIALSQGLFRAYLFPLYTPAGFALTTESPIDHPHHNSLWIGTDHLHCRLPYGAGGYEEATYNFYVNETFQGRAPGRIVQTGLQAYELDEEHLRIVQTLDWRGPR